MTIKFQYQRIYPIVNNLSDSRLKIIIMILLKLTQSLLKDLADMWFNGFINKVDKNMFSTTLIEH